MVLLFLLESNRFPETFPPVSPVYVFKILLSSARSREMKPACEYETKHTDRKTQTQTIQTHTNTNTHHTNTHKYKLQKHNGMEELLVFLNKCCFSSYIEKGYQTKNGTMVLCVHVYVCISFFTIPLRRRRGVLICLIYSPLYLLLFPCVFKFH
jgi:hypothetical protein